MTAGKSNDSSYPHQGREVMPFSQTMTWILSDVLEKKGHGDVNTLLPYFDAIRTHQQQEAMRVLISVLLGTSAPFSLSLRNLPNKRSQKGINGDPEDAIRLGIARGCGRLRDAPLYLSLSRHGGSNPHGSGEFWTSPSPQTSRLLNAIIQKTRSILLVNSIYTSLHTIFSANGYLTQRQLPLLIPSLYCRLSTCTSPVEQINENYLAELRSIYFRLCDDPRLVVRRQASRQFLACYSAFGVSYRPTFLSHLHSFLHDDVSRFLLLSRRSPSKSPSCHF